MTLDLFHGEGAFSPEELAEFIKLYQQFGKNDWSTDIDLGRSVDAKVQRMINEHCKNMGRLSDRLALTIIELNDGKNKHSENCTIYASQNNQTPEAGICTCGYGLRVMRQTGDSKELYSQELRNKLTGIEVITAK